MQLLQAAKFVLSIASGGFLLVCRRPMDFPSFVAAMYLLMILGFLLLYLSLVRRHLGSTPPTTADDSRVPKEQLLKTAKFVLTIATGGLLLVCRSPMDHPSYAMAMFLLMTVGFLLLYLSAGGSQLGWATTATTADGSCMPSSSLAEPETIVE